MIVRKGKGDKKREEDEGGNNYLQWTGGGYATTGCLCFLSILKLKHMLNRARDQNIEAI